MIGFFKTISLIRKLDKRQIKFRDLPFDKMREIDVVRIIRHHSVYFQELPKHLKTERVIYTVIMEKDNGIRKLGLDVVNDQYAADAISKWGRRAFQALHDDSKTHRVCMHAIKRDPRVFSDIASDHRTQEMANLAFKLDPNQISHIKDEHVTPDMVMAVLEKRFEHLFKYRLDGKITRDIAAYIIKERPEYISHVPEQHITPEAIALRIKDDPPALGMYGDARKCVEAIAISVEQMKGKSEFTLEHVIELEMEGGGDIEGMLTEFKQESPAIDPAVRARFFCALYRLGALDPEKLAVQAEDSPAIIEIMQLIHGSKTTLKFFPKAPGRGKWLMGELGL